MSKYEDDNVYEAKFVCFNVKHALDSLSVEERTQLSAMLDKIYEKYPREYLCINQDEPYADAVWNIIKEHEKRQIVAFVGRQGSGKDFQCNLLVDKGYKKVAFADALRDIAFSSFGIPLPFGMQRYDEMKSNEDCIKVCTEDSLHKLSFRQYLELLGTQGIRKYDNDFWCRAALKTIADNDYRKVCISDMRFLNEYYYLKAFAEKNGYEFKVIFCNYRSDRYQDNNTHESAIMANFFATHGYEDLEELSDKDFEAFVEAQKAGI